MMEMAAQTVSYSGDSMRTRPRVLTVHKYIPIAVVYFFFNSAALPSGLFVTTILSPLFYLWLYCAGKRWITIRFLICLSPFFLAHCIDGVESPFYYFRSLALLWTAYITAFAFCWGLLKTEQLERLFDELIAVNFAAFLVAIPLFITPARDLIWDNKSDVTGASHIYRLKLLCSEPSVYSSLMVPLIIFAIIRFILKPSKRNTVYTLMVALPFLFCQSFEGISGVTVGIGVAALVSFRHLLRRKKSFILLSILACLLGLLLLIPNPVSARLVQVLTGNDSSAHSRTIFSFLVAYTLAASKSLWWGVGLGQSKMMDVSNLGLGFTVGVIPNAVAGTFAEFGIIGMAARFTIEIVLFFRTRVYLNPFRLAIFIAAFGFQLSGSYLDNVQEALMWCFAFGPFFPELNRCQMKEA